MTKVIARKAIARIQNGSGFNSGSITDLRASV